MEARLEGKGMGDLGLYRKAVVVAQIVSKLWLVMREHQLVSGDRGSVDQSGRGAALSLVTLYIQAVMLGLDGVKVFGAVCDCSF